MTIEGLAALKPAFPNWGESTTTAGNASGVGDGAGLCILTTRSRAEKEGMKIVGKYVTSAVVGQSFTTAYFGLLFTRACRSRAPVYGYLTHLCYPQGSCSSWAVKRRRRCLRSTKV